MSDARPQPIQFIADQLEIPHDLVEPYGRFRAKVHVDLLNETRQRPNGKYVLVTAVTPTPFGEGKTTMSIGLGMGMAQIGQRAVVNLRQSSLGPTFGIKGGGAGGGRSRLIPLADSLLHVSGDIHAVGQAHNQIAALTDNSLYYGNPLEIVPERINIRRVVDVNDRFLRQITVGQGGPKHGIERTTGFDISVASELMAILALVDGQGYAEVMRNLRERIGRMVVAFSKEGKPITAEAIRAAGAATVLMRDAVHPTLMQTTENTPVFLHAGPFGNLAHGCSSILADRVGLKLADYVITEAGFDMSLGAEKFFDIKCRQSGLVPDAALLVATVRALKMHAGEVKVKAGKAIPDELLREDPGMVERGCEHLRVQLRNLKRFGIPFVVCINTHSSDSQSELDVIGRIASEEGAVGTAVSSAYRDGGRGSVRVAELIVEACQRGSDFRLLYSHSLPLKEKIRTIATSMYGADGVDYSERADAQLEELELLGFGRLSICMVKTPLSLSHKPGLKGVPRGFTLPIREARVSAGAGFVVPLVGEIVTMPGLGQFPHAFNVDIDDQGLPTGLF